MLDKLDRELVAHLQEIGRLSYISLARMVGVNERTVRNRIGRLLTQGLIKVTTRLNFGALGYSFVVILALRVELAKLRSVAEELNNHPNICYIANVTGRFDLMTTIVAKSPSEYASIMENSISAIPGILGTETFVILNTYKGEPGDWDTSQLLNNL